MIRLGDADPELLDAFMDSRVRRAEALSTAVAPAPEPTAEPSGSWAAGFAQSLHGVTRVT